MKKNIFNKDCLKSMGKVYTLKDTADANISKSERILSIATGAFILYHGIKNIFSYPLIAFGEIGTGGMLMQRGFSGKCALKAMAEEEAHFNDPIVVHTTEQVHIL